MNSESPDSDSGLPVDVDELASQMAYVVASRGEVLMSTIRRPMCEASCCCCGFFWGCHQILPVTDRLARFDLIV